MFSCCIAVKTTTYKVRAIISHTENQIQIQHIVDYPCRKYSLHTVHTVPLPFALVSVLYQWPDKTVSVYLGVLCKWCEHMDWLAQKEKYSPKWQLAKEMKWNHILIIITINRICEGSSRQHCCKKEQVGTSFDVIFYYYLCLFFLFISSLYITFLLDARSLLNNEHEHMQHLIHVGSALALI